MDDYQQFLHILQKRGSKKHHINHCLGSRDAWKWVRKNKWQALQGRYCEQGLYSCIINTINKLLLEKVLEGHEVEFPHQMGSLIVMGVPASITENDGKIETNYRVDWKKTLKYWHEDEEARNAHHLIKRIQPEIISLYYLKEKAIFRHRSMYAFRANRSAVRKLGAAIERGEIHTAVRDCNY